MPEGFRKEILAGLVIGGVLRFTFNAVAARILESVQGRT